MGAKQQFFTQLDSIFIGQSIQDHEDNSGYTNLIRLKSQYYQDIKKHIADAIEKHTASRSMEMELYNRLYTFFESYLNDTGTPFFYKTEFFKNIYARVYSNNKDVNLFWKTQDLYYVKSDPLYRTEILTARAAAGAPEYTFCFTPHADFRQAQGNEKQSSSFICCIPTRTRKRFTFRYHGSRMAIPLTTYCRWTRQKMRNAKRLMRNLRNIVGLTTKLLGLF